MSEQLQLFLNSELYRRFRQFHEENPEVYRLVWRFAEEARRAGYEHYGIASIFERVRWHMDIETRSEDGFKLNNNHRAYYARLLAEEHPEFEGFFRNRQVKGEIDGQT